MDSSSFHLRMLETLKNYTSPLLSSSSSDFAFEVGPEQDPGVAIIYGIGLSIILLVLFVGLEVICDDFLEPALQAVTEQLGLPHDVACATFLAFGGSAPEICISSVATIRGKVNVSIGAIMGSGIIAYTIIPAACVMVSKGSTLQLELIPLLRDIFFYCVAVIAFNRFAYSGGIGLYQSLFMLGLFVVYLITMFTITRYYHDPRLDGTSETIIGDDLEKENLVKSKKKKKQYGTAKDAVEVSPPPPKPSCSDRILGFTKSVGRFVGFPWTMLFRCTVPPLFTDLERDDVDLSRWWPITLLFSLAWISLLSEAVVEVVVRLADLIGMSHHLAGLTLVALGAQVPDMFASIAVAKKGEGPSSVANAVGSQIIDILIGMGLPFLIYNLVYGHEVFVSTKDKTGSIQLTSFVLAGYIGAFLLLSLVRCTVHRLKERAGYPRPPHSVWNEDHKPSLSKYDAGILVILYIAGIASIAVYDVMNS